MLLFVWHNGGENGFQTTCTAIMSNYSGWGFLIVNNFACKRSWC